MSDTSELELFCPRCESIEPCTASSMIARLRSAGLLRREAKPDLDVVRELFRESAQRFVCQQCDAVGLIARPATVESWPEARTCEACKARIPPERLEIFPNATRCAACESQLATAGDEPEYCPRCGELMKVSLSRKPGISRYVLSCPRCRT